MSLFEGNKMIKIRPLFLRRGDSVIARNYTVVNVMQQLETWAL